MILPRKVLESVVAHARATLPAECCGLLIGRADRVVESVRARNLDESLNRFLIDPRDHIEARRRARARGLDVMGFYHSHPRGEAHPSPSDIEEAFDSNHVHVIVSLRDDQPVARAFKFDREGIAELPIEEGRSGPVGT